ncbi:SRPBCC family protein [Nocardioides rotundus]|uniref:SRPBCC family protein n=1 Tax=Nocardioides rotundus TaxID=1774216 RepID=UPI001CBD66D9|nr:SRPBCC family protein [Nocardioides rotundus]UAL31642.1 SRPBCC family protein [Nocardioides rotundus]
MTRFSARNVSDAVLRATPEEVWAILTDPELLVRFTPNLKRIDADGDVWTWHLTRIPVLSSAIEPSFTELMEFDRPRRITFKHDETRTEEKAGVVGEYFLEPVTGGTHVSIDLEIWVELPFPRVARPAVERVMSGVVAGMGFRFGQNVRRYLGE